MTTANESRVVWVVSAVYSPVGEVSDYEIDELDLTDKPMKIVNLITAKMGKGVFASYEEAENWARGEVRCGGCTHSDGGTCSSGLCKKKSDNA